MAKKSTIETSNTTDLFIEDQLYSSRDYGLSAGEKVAIGFGIAGGAIILGFMIYEGIKYIITRNSYNHYTAIPTQNVNPNLQQLPAQQYAQYVQPQPVPINPVPSSPLNEFTQRVNNLSQQYEVAHNEFIQGMNNVKQQHEAIKATEQEANKKLQQTYAEIMQPNSRPAPALQPQNNTQPVSSTQEIVSAITAMSQGISAIMNTQNAMVNTMQEMVKGISIRNSQEFEELQNENAFLKQQVNEINIARERAESVANHMQGQYDNLANQVGAPLSSQSFRNMYGTPAENTNKYPNLNPNPNADGIVR